LGVLLAVAYVCWQGHRQGYRFMRLLDGALWTLTGGLLGARLAYFASKWGDYAGKLPALLSLWGDGLIFQGGLVAGLLAVYLFSRQARLPFIHLADLAAPAVSLAQGLGWAGAHLHGANCGVVVSSPLSMWLPDLYGVYGPRFPTQFLASLLGLLLFFHLHQLSERNPPPGMVALLYLLINGAGHLILEFTRADRAPSFGVLRITQVAGLIEAVIAAALLWHLWFVRRARRRSRSATEEV
jgi:phosphatidylglycerol:prolipoprotein diacylglycerol transferase